MFNNNSDYALNKRDPRAIVCQSATDEPIRLTREDFTSDEEFLKWKKWSDQDYHITENDDHIHKDHCIQLVDELHLAVPSIEDDFVAHILLAERIENHADLLEQVKSNLTDKQYRRLWMYYIEGLTEVEIAMKEGVGQPRISYSLSAGRRIVENFFQEFLRNRG